MWCVVKKYFLPIFYIRTLTSGGFWFFFLSQNKTTIFMYTYICKMQAFKRTKNSHILCYSWSLKNTQLTMKNNHIDQDQNVSSVVCNLYSGENVEKSINRYLLGMCLKEYFYLNNFTRENIFLKIICLNSER